MRGDKIVLDEIAASLEPARLLSKLHIKPGSTAQGELEGLIYEAQKIIRPKAFYYPAYIEGRSESAVVINGVSFQSRVLAVNLRQAHRVFPYLVTCGPEAEVWMRSIHDVLYQFWADTIAQQALHLALRLVERDICEYYAIAGMASMSPGRLTDWAIEEQRALFTLLGEGPALIGVQLLESYLMTPTKTLSGIRYPTEESFESCQLCPRVKCVGRKAAYDRHLMARKYSPVEE